MGSPGAKQYILLRTSIFDAAGARAAASPSWHRASKNDLNLKSEPNSLHENYLIHIFLY